MHISKQSVQAIEAVLFIACCNGEPVKSRRISREQGSSNRYLEITLQTLTGAGILVGTRGPQGGYRLGRAPAEITLSEIDDLVIQPDDRRTVRGALRKSCLAEKIVQPLWEDLAGRWTTTLRAISIADLVRKARGAGISIEN